MQAIQWLRHGCIPVAVVEGRTPPEKLEALRERFKAANGCAGGGGGGGASFQALGAKVAAMLEAMVSLVSNIRRVV